MFCCFVNFDVFFFFVFSFCILSSFFPYVRFVFFLFAYVFFSLFCFPSFFCFFFCFFFILPLLSSSVPLILFGFFIVARLVCLLLGALQRQALTEEVMVFFKKSCKLKKYCNCSILLKALACKDGKNKTKQQTKAKQNKIK